MWGVDAVIAAIGPRGNKIEPRPGPSDFGVMLVETRCRAYDTYQRL